MPAPAHADRRYLEHHGNTWRVVVNVPKAFRGKLGTKLKVSLGTDSLRDPLNEAADLLANRAATKEAERMFEAVAQVQRPQQGDVATIAA